MMANMMPLNFREISGLGQQPRPAMRRDLLLFILWLLVIGLCLFFGRRVGPWFEGRLGYWAAAGLAAVGLLSAAWAFGRLKSLPPGIRLKTGLGLFGAAAGLGVLAWAQPLLIERTHLVLYGVLGILAFRLCGRWYKGGRRALIAVLICALAGGLDEFGQYLHPERVGEPRDALTNAAASALVVWAAWLLDRPDGTV
jgi:hypothetical protein